MPSSIGGLERFSGPTIQCYVEGSLSSKAVETLGDALHLRQESLLFFLTTAQRQCFESRLNRSQTLNRCEAIAKSVVVSRCARTMKSSGIPVFPVANPYK